MRKVDVFEIDGCGWDREIWIGIGVCGWGR